MFKFPPIPTPPTTVRAPELELIDPFKEVIPTVLKVEFPEKLVDPPIDNPPLMVALPLTSNATLGLIFPIPTNPPLVFIPNVFAPF